MKYSLNNEFAKFCRNETESCEAQRDVELDKVKWSGNNVKGAIDAFGKCILRTLDLPD